ncbi:MAG: FAD:protein FMN transferase [Pirellulaceae bacterium]|jgi:thiamine biosynthesis lipoprotein|nr:FAD:protein FMN transferase [Pirellulaceae bacterium]
MAEPARTNRREFLQGRSAIEALGDAVIGSPEPLRPPAALAPERSYLLEVGREAMACQFDILFCPRRYPQGADAALAALDLVEWLEAQLTVYRETSELMAINRRAGAGAVAAEPQLFELLVRAAALSRATCGAFDITSGPLSKVWGFYRRQGMMPTGAAIEEALAQVGIEGLELNAQARTVALARPGMELNLGAIGKGYALDRAASLLASQGVDDFLIHGGNSSVLARGDRQPPSSIEASDSVQPATSASGGAPQRGWSIALRHPLRPEVRLAEFWLVNQALGTSGSGTQFFHYQGKRYGHVIDPRTGWPADRVLSATVIAPTAEQADALSTALYVMGLGEARDFCAQHPAISALVVTSAAKAGQIELHPLNLAESAWQAL